MTKLAIYVKIELVVCAQITQETVQLVLQTHLLKELYVSVITTTVGIKILISVESVLFLVTIVPNILLEAV